MQIRCGAVPEHFFYPWKTWLSQKKQHSERWLWKEFPGGSGEMLQAIEEDKLDAAFLLTESALFHKSQKDGLKILFPFIMSPLQWGIFTGSKNPVQTVADGETYAISRYKSGSHLMAILEADGRGKAIREEDWKIAGNLEEARKMLVAQEADLFFWERWTTRPLVESGDFRMLDVFPGPWPAFVFCVSQKWFDKNRDLSLIESDFNEVCQLAKQIKKSIEYHCPDIAITYGLTEEMVNKWITQVEWAANSATSLGFLGHAEALMKKAGIISPETPCQASFSPKAL
jgi:hypothetical protein